MRSINHISLSARNQKAHENGLFEEEIINTQKGRCNYLKREKIITRQGEV
ncbi:MAG: hypothetical protein M3362_14070 [Acidobacteriota bacterium]|nr:hypothetical protein [Acidobacteriota bacterium]